MPLFEKKGNLALGVAVLALVGAVAFGVYEYSAIGSLKAEVQALSASQAAPNEEWEGHRETIAAGKAYEQDLSCKTGKVLSGGYSLDSVSGGTFSKVVFATNAPTPSGPWHFSLYNTNDTDVRVDFRVAVLCK